MADQYVRDHQAWLGYLQPDGLVVSPAALVDSQVILPHDAGEQQTFSDLSRRRRSAMTNTSNDRRSDAVSGNLSQWPAELLYGVNPARPLPEALSRSIVRVRRDLVATMARRSKTEVYGPALAAAVAIAFPRHRSGCGSEPRRARLVGLARAALRAAAARDEGADRPDCQRHTTSPHVCAAWRERGQHHFPRPRHGGSCGPASLPRFTCCSSARILNRPRNGCRRCWPEPGVPEQGFHPALRAGPGRVI